ncbi:hypothetical protein C1I99_13335 [Micromonospora deserti]|uniref:Right handed beta helix domain-containing protein n=2 Tax=Micromonospora deserti TaxID=2070366 RepID=A0A2W2CKJ7_9ACTN|nr:hypothetical protein C1I99_13335 [Micromonospora deserti]
MSNYLRKNKTSTKAAPRRRIWVATGVAGLTGVVGLAASGAATSAGAAGVDRLASLKWSTAEQVVKADGKRDDAAQGEKHDRGKGEDDRSGGDWSGGDWSGQSNGKDGREWRGKDDRRDDRKDDRRDDRKDGEDHAKEVPCDTETLVEVVNKAVRDDGGVFKLAKDCTYKFTEQTDQNAFPVIDEEIKILGNGAKLVHEGTELFRFFEVNSGGDLTLKDLTLSGGQVSGPPPAEGQGGALLVQEGGKAHLKKVTLVHNRATATGNGGNGGAIANFGYVTLEDSVAKDNHARSTGTGGNGGAIYNEGELKVHNSLLEKNTATTNAEGTGGTGGAIANFNDGIVTIAYSQIIKNLASNDGGGINSEDDTRLTVNRTKIAGNTAGGEGGGIYFDSSNAMRVEHAIIADNKAAEDGGGIWHDSDTSSTITGTKFYNNTAGRNGGGLFNDGDLTLADSEFKDNDARQGGAIFNNSGDLKIRHTKIIKNYASAPAGAGGIFRDGGTVELDDKTVVKKNEPTNCAGTVDGCFN